MERMFCTVYVPPNRVCLWQGDGGGGVSRRGWKSYWARIGRLLFCPSLRVERIFHSAIQAETRQQASTHDRWLDETNLISEVQISQPDFRNLQKFAVTFNSKIIWDSGEQIKPHTELDETNRRSKR